MNYLSFDIEDWFHLLDVPYLEDYSTWDNYESRVEAPTMQILELLDTYETKAIFFVLGWISDKYPNLVREIEKRGHLIGTHGYHHRLVYKMSPEEFEKDLIRSIKSIESVTGQKPKLFRAPGFSIGPDEDWAFDLLIKNGIKVDASVFSPARSHGGYGSDYNREYVIQRPNGYLLELPMSYSNIGPFKVVFHGGGYFRMFPSFILRLSWSKKYNMIYLHPRDFDSEQKRLPGLGVLKTFKSYVGLRHTFYKLESLLKKHNFILPEL